MNNFLESLSAIAGVLISVLLTGLLSYSVYLRSKREDYNTKILNKKQELNKVINSMSLQFSVNGIENKPFNRSKMEQLINDSPKWAKSPTKAREMLREIMAMTPLPFHTPGRSTQRILDIRSMADENFLEWVSQFESFLNLLYLLNITPHAKNLLKEPLGRIPYFTMEWFSNKCLEAGEYGRSILWLRTLKSTYEWGYRVKHRKRLYFWFTVMVVTGVLAPWLGMLVAPNCTELSWVSMGGFVLSSVCAIKSLLLSLKED